MSEIKATSKETHLPSYFDSFKSAVSQIPWKKIGVVTLITGLIIAPMLAPVAAAAFSSSSDQTCQDGNCLADRVQTCPLETLPSAAITDQVADQCFAPDPFLEECPTDYECYYSTALKHMEVVAKAHHLDYNPEYPKILEAVTDVLDQYEGEAALSALQDIAYQNLTYAQFSDIQPILQFALYCPNPNPSDVASLILRAYAENPLRALASKQNATHKFPSWGEAYQFPEGAKIQVSYGGGDRYLTEFFNGSNDGYAMEASGKGIFVTIQHPDYASSSLRERDWNYASRTPLQHFDTPTVFKAKIDPKHLLKVNHNSYEAVLLQKNVDKLTHVERETQNLRDLPLHHMIEWVQQIIPPARMGPNFQFDWGPVLWEPVKNLFSSERLKRLDRCLRRLAGM